MKVGSWLNVLALNVLVACASSEEPSGADEPTTTETNEPTASTPSATSMPSETSDPTLPEPPEPDADAPTRGAFSLHVEPKGNCSAGDTWIDFPKVAGGHPVTATEHATLAEDLTRDAEGFAIKMQCEWTVTEDPYTALIGISSTSDTASGVFVSMTAVLSASGPQQSRLLVRRSDQETQYAAVETGERCDVTLLHVDMDAQTVWASLTCASLKDREATEECAATEGYFYFENCKLRQ